MSKHAESTITFNAPSDVKERLSSLAKDNGLSISDLMRMAASQILSRGIIIEPSFEPSNYLLSAIKESEKDLAGGKTTTVKTPEELDNYFQKLKR